MLSRKKTSFNSKTRANTAVVIVYERTAMIEYWEECDQISQLVEAHFL
jgi:hypothetical protein